MPITLARSLIANAVVCALQEAVVARHSGGFHFVASKKSASKKTLLVRGGGLGLDGKTAGKFLTGLWLAQGAAFSLAPKAMAGVYGLDRESDVTEFIVENTGGATLATGITAYCMQIKDMSLGRAIGWSGVSWILHHLYWYWVGSYNKVGFKKTNALFTTFTSLMLLHVGFADPTWAPTYLKASMTIYTLSAIQGILAPETSLNFWGCNEDVNDGVKLALKVFMYHLLGHQIHGLCLIQGVEPSRAIAFASCSVLIFFLDRFFLSKEIPKFVKKSTGYGFWLCLFPYLICAILSEGLSNSDPAV